MHVMSYRVVSCQPYRTKLPSSTANQIRSIRGLIAEDSPSNMYLPPHPSLTTPTTPQHCPRIGNTPTPTPTPTPTSILALSLLFLHRRGGDPAMVNVLMPVRSPSAIRDCLSGDRQFLSHVDLVVFEEFDARFKVCLVREKKRGVSVCVSCLFVGWLVGW